MGRIPDASPEIKRRALAYVLSFFLAFFLLTMTVALFLARRKQRSNRFNNRVYINTETVVSPDKIGSAPSTPVRSRSGTNRSSLYDSLKTSRFSVIMSSPLKTPTRPQRAQSSSKTHSACPEQCLDCLAQDIDKLSTLDVPLSSKYFQDGIAPTPPTPAFGRRSSVVEA